MLTGLLPDGTTVKWLYKRLDFSDSKDEEQVDDT